MSLLDEDEILQAPDGTEYTLRQYQKIIYEKSIEENLIVSLPTGTGKTFIAISLIRRKLKETVGEYPNTAKRTFFLSPTKCLVKQQFSVLESFLPAKCVCLTGDDSVENFCLEKWNTFFAEYNILVMTPAILVDLLSKGFINVTNINLIVIDEAHWAIKKDGKHSEHPYRQLMDLYNIQCKKYELDTKQRPHILGLSASLMNSSIKLVKLEDTMKEIETIYNAKIFTVCPGHFYNEAKIFVCSYDSMVGRNKKIKFDFEKFLNSLQTTNNEFAISRQIFLIIKQIQNTLYMNMGPWCAYELINFYLNSVPNLPGEMQELIKTLLRLIQNKISNLYNGLTNNPSFALEHISGKLESFLKILKLFKENLNCIVFVDQRTDANILYRWLKYLSANVPEYNFVKASFICGSSTKGFVHFDHSDEDFAEKFGKKEVNVIIATSVLEEGIDISCNLVIRYDIPQNYRVFCQSKGRARQANSYFILMLENSINDFDESLLATKQMLYDFFLLESYFKDLNKNYSQSDRDDEKLIVNSSRFFETGDALLSECYSLGILNNYVSNLPNDVFTDCRSNFVLIENNESSISSSSSSSSKDTSKSYCYLFLFPSYTPFKGCIIKGDFCPNKKSAKSNCAFHVCRFLIEKGEINSHLQVVRGDFLINKHFEELNLTVYAKKNAQRAKKYNLFANNYSKFFSNPVASHHGDHQNCFYYLYSLQFQSDWNKENFNANLLNYAPEFLGKSNTESIGLLSRHKLPINQVESYFYFNLFRIKFKAKYQYRMQLSTKTSNSFDGSKYKLICFFHQHVLDVILKEQKPNSPENKTNTKHVNETSEESTKFTNCLFVPIVPKTFPVINFDLIQELYEWKEQFDLLSSGKSAHTGSPNTSETLSLYAADHHTLFVCYNHTEIILHYIKDITETLPTSQMKDSDSTFVQYFQNRYNRTVTNTDDCLIHLGRVAKFRRSYHITSKEPIKNKKSAQSHLLMPAELMLKYPLSNELYQLLLSIPMVLYRLEQFCIGYEFLQHFTEDIDLVNLNFDERFDIEDLLLSKKEDENNSDTYSNLDEELKLISLENAWNEQRIITKPDYFTQVVQMFLPNQNDESKLSNDSDSSNKLLYSEYKQPVEIGNDVDEDKLFDQLYEKMRTLFLEEKNNRKQLAEPTETMLINSTINYGETSIFFFSGNILDYINIHFDTFSYYNCPNPWQIVQAFTLAKAKDLWNMERLETIGDSFIKMTSALYLYFKYPNYDESKLVSLKDAMVCNENLYQLALARNLQSYIFGRPFLLSKNWFPPFYYYQAQRSNVITVNVDKDEVLSKNSETISSPEEKSDKIASLRDKDISDCVESLIGAFLVYGSAGTALAFLDWIKLKAFNPCDYYKEIDPVKLFDPKIEEMCIVNNTENDDPKEVNVINKFLQNNFVNTQSLEKIVDDAYSLFLLDQVENIIDYKFRYRTYLVQAFTHSSYANFENFQQISHISNYQRLEYIGDAILDYLITHFIYRNNRDLTPYKITSLRSALVNNTFYAEIVVKFGLHKHLRYSNQSIMMAINKFMKKFHYKCFSQLNHILNKALDDNNSGLYVDVDVTKVLADIFESMIAAVYIDSGFSLDKTWQVAYRLIKPECDYFQKNIPIMPLALLEKEFVGRFKFCEFKKIMNKFQIALVVDEHHTFIGYGNNKKMCKLSAAKRALGYFNKNLLETLDSASNSFDEYNNNDDESI